jgi:hypothetical protein
MRFANGVLRRTQDRDRPVGFAAVGPNFLRAAGAFYAVAHGGSHQPEQNRSVTLFFGCRTQSQTQSQEKSEASKLLREFSI